MAAFGRVVTITPSTLRCGDDVSHKCGGIDRSLARELRGLRLFTLGGRQPGEFTAEI
jgi:hypothetical protein